MTNDCSILIPCHNAMPFLRRCIESALDQDALEVILINDGSTDESLEIAASFGDRIRVVTQLRKGVQATRNELTKLAQGEWLQFLDADDELKLGKIETQIAAATPEIDILYCNLTKQTWSGGALTRSDFINTDGDTFFHNLIMWERLPQTNCFLYRRDRFMPWDETYPHCHEFKLALDLMKAGRRFKHVPIDGVLYRRGWHTQQVTGVMPELLKTRERLNKEMLSWVKSVEFPASQYGLVSHWYPMIEIADRRLALEKTGEMRRA